MSKRHTFLFALLSFVTVFALSSGRAHAAKIFDGETHSPSGHRTICDAGTPVDFSAYPSDISIDLATGLMSYNINVTWASCNGTQTRAYAIYSIGAEVCPLSGTYGATTGGGWVTDCVKYVGNPPYQGDGNGLTCSAGLFGLPGTDDRCVTQGFSGVRKTDNQPTSANSAVIPMTYQIPNWNQASDTGSWTISNAMCQFYKTGNRFGTITDNSRCMDVTMKVSWKQQVTYPQITCGTASTAPARLEEGQNFNLGTSFTLGGGAGQTDNTTYSISISVPSIGINNQSAASNVSIPWSGGAGSGIINNLSIATAGIYPVTYTVDVVGATNTPQTCNGLIKVVRVPYLSVYGADIKAGGAFIGGNCAQTADIKANTNVGLGGSGVEFAATALGTITGFNSARLRGAVPTAPKGLTFANAGPLAGQFGGQNCVEDYFADGAAITPDTSTVINLNTLTSGSYKYRNTNTITLSGQVTGNNRVSLYIDGDLRITSNATLANTSWATVDDIPSLRVYVKGDIYIESDVTQIDGLYVSQPTGANGGTIITCVTPGADTAVATNQLADDCKNQLRINGAFIAQKVRFLRAVNSLKDAGINERTAAGSLGAEVFNLTPDIYIAAPQPAPGSETDQTRYDSFTGLPPIL